MKFITYDLGTGGVKAALYDENMQTLAKSFIEYPTSYPAPGWHEQRGLLEAEGVGFRENGCVDMKKHRWDC